MENSFAVSVKKLDRLNKNDYRNILILYIGEESIFNKKYIRIVGIDIISRQIVLIVDTNGKQYGLHTFTESFLKLKKATVIKAKFQYVEVKGFVNTLRITSVFSIIGVSNLRKLQEKYKILTLKGFVNKFDEINNILLQNFNCENYIIVNCTGTMVKEYKTKSGNTKYQIKIGENFADFSQNIDIKNYINLYFKGYVLLSGKISNNHKCLNVQCFWGNFMTYEENEERKKNNKLFNAQYEYENTQNENYYETDSDKLFRHYELATEEDLWSEEEIYDDYLEDEQYYLDEGEEMYYEDEYYDENDYYLEEDLNLISYLEELKLVNNIGQPWRKEGYNSSVTNEAFNYLNYDVDDESVIVNIENKERFLVYDIRDDKFAIDLKRISFLNFCDEELPF